MMRRCVQFALLVCCLALSGCADIVMLTTSSYRTSNSLAQKRIALLDFAGEGGQAVADVMAMKLLQAGFEVLERDRIQYVLYELQIGEQGYKELSDLEKAQKLGRVLNADAIVTGKLLRLVPPKSCYVGGDRLGFLYGGAQLAARAINVKTGEILWMATVEASLTAQTGKYLKYMDFLDEPCAELALSLRDSSYIDKTHERYTNKEIARLRASRGL